MISEQVISKVESLLRDSWLILFSEEDVKDEIISYLKLESQHYLIDGIKVSMVKRTYSLEQTFSQLSNFNKIVLLAVARTPTGFKATAIYQAKGVSLREVAPQLLKAIQGFMRSQQP